MRPVLMIAMLVFLAAASAPWAAARSDLAAKVPDYTKYEPDVIAAVAKRVHLRMLKAEAALIESNRRLKAVESQLAEARKQLATRDQQINHLQGLLSRAGVRVTPAATRRPASQPARTNKSKLKPASADPRTRKFTQALKRLGVNEMVVSRIVLDGRTATLTVTPGWHTMPHQLRLEVAEQFYKAWAAVQSRRDRINARLELIDNAGTVIGGSSAGNPREIWAKKD